MKQDDVGSNPSNHPISIGGCMDRHELRKFKRLVEQLKVPSLRKIPNQANYRWILANAWIENGDNPRLNELLKLIKVYL